MLDEAGCRLLVVFANASVDATDLQGSSPLHLSARHECFRTAAILLDAGADINARDRFASICTSNPETKGDSSHFSVRIEQERWRVVCDLGMSHACRCAAACLPWCSMLAGT